MSSQYYILDGKQAIPTNDIERWARFQGGNRRVEFSTVGDSEISTVFLGLNHNWSGGPPLLFETMVFSGALDGEQDRYTTWEQAEAGHKAMVERVKASQP